MGTSGGDKWAQGDLPMPTTFRLLTILASMAAIAYASVWALANLVTPTQSEISIRIPADRVNPPRGNDAAAQDADNKPVAGD